jgi:hypothetical protein
MLLEAERIGTIRARMTDKDLLALQRTPGVSEGRLKLAVWIDSPRVQAAIIAVILLNAAILGVETSPALMARWGAILVPIASASSSSSWSWR